ncbi:hypothetical protein OG840_60115 [Streptomyces sp. NBC_01764]|uniref:hypothetical protein n=1 Tax=Streptomyces sp. NBC_01764 TaxID=2975935 RepID=UPI00224FBD30|nr:hypothetical protein [Streptomyces sp. NBC_01764]MCX4411319.1 hypothetical protein [Streptomyces sp. NBC_01764]
MQPGAEKGIQGVCTPKAAASRPRTGRDVSSSTARRSLRAAKKTTDVGEPSCGARLAGDGIEL